MIEFLVMFYKYLYFIGVKYMYNIVFWNIFFFIIFGFNENFLFIIVWEV